MRYEAECAKDPKFGVLRSIERRGPRDVRIRYSILRCEPFLTAGDLESMGRLLDVRGFELDRTHWAVKDVDLPRELRPRGILLPGWASGSGGGADVERHQFEVALSFPGEHREYVDAVAGELERVLGADACFYDRFYEAQLARPNLDVLLQEIYGERSGLWSCSCARSTTRSSGAGSSGAESSNGGALGSDREIKYVRLGEGVVAGMTRLDGYLDATTRTPGEVALMIAQRARSGPVARRSRSSPSFERRPGERSATGAASALAGPRSGDLAISGTVTDAMRHRFLAAAFEEIVGYVTNSAEALQAGSVEAIATRIDATSFEATLFVGGRRRSHGGIWLSTGGQPGLGAGVYYSSEGVGNRNGFNEMLTVENEGGEVLLRAMVGDWAGRHADRLSTEAAAEYMWQKLKRPLA